MFFQRFFFLQRGCFFSKVFFFFKKIFFEGFSLEVFFFFRTVLLQCFFSNDCVFKVFSFPMCFLSKIFPEVFFFFFGGGGFVLKVFLLFGFVFEISSFRDVFLQRGCFFFFKGFFFF